MVAKRVSGCDSSRRNVAEWMLPYAMRTLRRGGMRMPKTNTLLLRPRPDRTGAVPPGLEKSRIIDPSDHSVTVKPEQEIVCRFCHGVVTTRDEAVFLLGAHIGSLVINPRGGTHGIAFFRTAQVRLENLRFFTDPANELVSAHCRICSAQLGLRLVTPDIRFYALLLDRIHGA